MIRRLRPADWSRYRDIRLDMLAREPEAFGSRLSDWQAKSRPEIETWLREVACFAAVVDGRCIAAAAWAFPPGRSQGPEGIVIGVYTRARHRGHGLGRCVMAAVEAHAGQSGLQRLSLNVAKHNHAAIALYRALGYVTAGGVPAPDDRPGFDQLQFTKTLIA